MDAMDEIYKIRYDGGSYIGQTPICEQATKIARGYAKSTGLRRFRKVILMVARKNGKSRGNGMMYSDERGFLFIVKHGTYGWTIYCFNPKKKIWWPWPCTSWFITKREAVLALMRHARKRSWQKEA